MTVYYKTKGIVFKKSDRNESDRIFSVFTNEFGRLDITAKAVRKMASKLRADIDIFYLSEIEFIQGKNTKTLTDAAKIKKFGGIFKNSGALAAAHKIAEVLDGFVKGQEKDEFLFGLLEDIFNKLDLETKKIKNPKLAFYYFLWNFLSSQGYRPEVKKCAGCKSKLNPYNIYFSHREGGIICKKCLNADKNAQKINSDVAKTLRIILDKDWDIVSRLKIEPSSQELFSKISEGALQETLD